MFDSDPIPGQGSSGAEPNPATAPATTEARKTLPEGYIAIVRGESGKFSRYEEDTDGRGERFWIRLGKPVSPPLKANGFPEGLAEGRVDLFDTPTRGTITIEPLGSGNIEVYPPQGSQTGNVEGEVNLMYFDYDQSPYDPVRTATLDASVFTSQGFDLRHGDKSNVGLALNPQLSQLFFDFKEGQGQFANLPPPAPLPKPQGIVFR
ncbi:MAG: hypothetical protein HY426_03820 [Candidatus Levybacteria bacterium]|nr:hypothetical protein [Candidatus Levybacteria bacterium]